MTVNLYIYVTQPPTSFMVFTSQTSPSQTVSRLLSILAILSASVAVTYLLLPDPLADVFFAGIMMVSIIFALVGRLARGRTGHLSSGWPHSC